MKTSVIEVHAMLSVLSVDEVERRIGEVPGVESVTVNFAAETATVRYDETRLEVADIKSAVRQRGHESAAPASPASPARWMNTGAQDVLNSISLPSAGIKSGGNTSQPSRQPVIRKLFEKLLATTRRSWGSATSRKLGAQRAPAAK